MRTRSPQAGCSAPAQSGKRCEQEDLSGSQHNKTLPKGRGDAHAFFAPSRMGTRVRNPRHQSHEYSCNDHAGKRESRIRLQRRSPCGPQSAEVSRYDPPLEVPDRPVRTASCSSCSQHQTDELTYTSDMDGGPSTQEGCACGQKCTWPRQGPEGKRTRKRQLRVTWPLRHRYSKRVGSLS